MTLHISLPPDAEARLRERAAAEGKDPATFALEAVQEKLGPGNGVSDRTRAAERSAAWDRFVTGMQEWARNLPPGHRVNDDRASIYEGRGE